MMKLLVSTAVFLALSSSDVHACKCAGPPNWQDADFIFEGRPIQRTRGKSDVLKIGIPVNTMSYTFDVTRVWKGNVGPRVHVTSSMGSGSCGIAFDLGTKYVVTARVSTGMATTLRCGDLATASERSDALLVLGQPTKEFADRHDESDISRDASEQWTLAEYDGDAVSNRWRLAMLAFFLGCVTASLWTAIVVRRRRRNGPN